MLDAARFATVLASLLLLLGCGKGRPPAEVAVPTEPARESIPAQDVAQASSAPGESLQSPPIEAGSSPAETTEGTGDAEEPWDPVAIFSPSAEEQLQRLLAEHVAGLTSTEVGVVARAVLLHARMDEQGLAALVHECGGSFTASSTRQPPVDMTGGSIVVESIVAGRDRLRGDPRFGIPNPGPVAMLRDWIYGVVIHSDSSGAVTLPIEIAQARAPAVVVAVPIEFSTQRIALVITFIEVDGRLIPFRSDCFATQTGENDVFPLMRPLL